MLSYHNGSHIQALTQLYPELNLLKKKFSKSTGIIHYVSGNLKFNELKIYFTEGYMMQARRRSFFDNFARSHNFDPLDAEKWYSFTKKDITDVVSSFIFSLFVSCFSE